MPGPDGSPGSASTHGSRYPLANTKGATSPVATCIAPRAWNGPTPADGSPSAPPPGDASVPHDTSSARSGRQDLISEPHRRGRAEIPDVASRGVVAHEIGRVALQ